MGSFPDFPCFLFTGISRREAKVPLKVCVCLGYWTYMVSLGSVKTAFGNSAGFSILLNKDYFFVCAIFGCIRAGEVV